MKKVFADTAYWIAILNPRDELHSRALSVSKSMSGAIIVTSEMVLTELLNKFTSWGKGLRKAAGELVRKIEQNPNHKIIAQTRDQFNEALAFYLDRLDKEWSLTDCASIKICEREGITEILTSDNHFEQAGFTSLLK